MDPPLSSRWSKDEITAGIKSHRQSRFAIATQKFPISKADAIAALEARLAIPVPEMIFGDNLLAIAHAPSGWVLRFAAPDALDAVDKTDRNMLRVAYARDWESTREETTQKIKEVVKPYDWTYSTTFRGAVKQFQLLHHHRNKQEQKRGSENKDDQGEEARKDGENKEEKEEKDGEPPAVPAAKGTVPQGKPLDFAPTEKRIPMEVLRRRDPILFFDEVVLYESELDDNGVSLYTAKIRVHEKCLFVLARLFMRLDNVLVRIRDTRVFVDLDTDEVIREYTAKEATFAEVQQALFRSGTRKPEDVVSAVRDPNTLEPLLRIVEQHIDAVTLSS